MPTSPEVLLIRADGGTAIGTGHVMRCLALAQAWTRSGGHAVFALAQSTPALLARLASEGLSTLAFSATPGDAEDAAQTLSHARSLSAVWIVADGYGFGAPWQKQIKDAGHRLLLLDDYGHAAHYHADIVLNQNLSADETLYARRDAATRLLLGTRHALLRREFLAARDTPRTFPSAAKKILVTLGGSDPDNVTALALAALARLPGIEARVVAGGSNPHLAALRAATAPLAPAIQLVENATDMPALMTWADVAFSSAGSTSWELACLGLPTVLAILADNQKGIAAALADTGVCLNLGDRRSLTADRIADALRALLANAELRKRMQTLGQRLVDGRGAARVATLMRAALIDIRRAREEDCRPLWEWANDPVVRATAFNPAPIPWESHLRWFDAKLHDPASAIFVGLDPEGVPFGQVRFDWNDQGVAEIDVNVAQRRRHCGQGGALIRRAVQELLATSAVRSVHARVKPQNQASLRAFEKAGFDLAGSSRVGDPESVLLTLAQTR